MPKKMSWKSASRTALGICCYFLWQSQPIAAANDISVLLHNLDYLAVDYPATVKNGKVVDQEEYTEHREFVDEALRLTAALPDNPVKPRLVVEVQNIAKAIDQRVDGKTVQALCRNLLSGIIVAYQVPITPQKTPDVTKAATLFAAYCAQCHGTTGHGDGPNAAGLSPKPADFHFRERQRQRSIYGLYTTITHGIEGTAMPAFSQFNEEQRWALAFYVGTLYASDEDRKRGAALWHRGEYHEIFNHLDDLTQAIPANIQAKYGIGASSVLAYLRSQPALLAQAPTSPIAITREKLTASLDAYRSGDNLRAYELAVSSYLEGFELAEDALSDIDPELKRKIEYAMTQYRQGIKNGKFSVAEAEQHVEDIQTILDYAASRLIGGDAF